MFIFSFIFIYIIATKPSSTRVKLHRSFSSNRILLYYIIFISLNRCCRGLKYKIIGNLGFIFIMKQITWPIHNIQDVIQPETQARTTSLARWYALLESRSGPGAGLRLRFRGSDDGSSYKNRLFKSFYSRIRTLN